MFSPSFQMGLKVGWNWTFLLGWNVGLMLSGGSVGPKSLRWTLWLTKPLTQSPLISLSPNTNLSLQLAKLQTQSPFKPLTQIPSQTQSPLKPVPSVGQIPNPKPFKLRLAKPLTQSPNINLFINGSPNHTSPLWHNIRPTHTLCTPRKPLPLTYFLRHHLNLVAIRSTLS